MGDKIVTAFGAYDIVCNYSVHFNRSVTEYTVLISVNFCVNTKGQFDNLKLSLLVAGMHGFETHLSRKARFQPPW